MKKGASLAAHTMLVNMLVCIASMLWTMKFVKLNEVDQKYDMVTMGRNPLFEYGMDKAREYRHILYPLIHFQDQ